MVAKKFWCLAVSPEHEACPDFEPKEGKTCGECKWFHQYPNDLESKDRCNMFFFRDRGNNTACEKFKAWLNAPAETKKAMEKMSKTCGECKHFDKIYSYCCITPDLSTVNIDNPACVDFAPKSKQTNGDVIRQMSNEELASEFGYPCPPLPNKHCRGISNEECTECWLAWLNAPAESQLNDAIQNVIKDGAKTAIEIHEAAYAPDMNDGTMKNL
jgi:hypothetical protein